MTTQNDLLTELRSYWEFASVCQFLHLFSKGLRVEGFETEDLENQLISDTLTHNLAVLHISLLKALFGPPNSRLITYESWQQYLVREYTKRELECELSGPDAEYGNLPLRERVLILYHLCEWQLDNTDRFRAAVGDEDEGEWRVEPVGTDTKGNTYWLFDDNRLYRESPAAAPAKGGNKKKGRRQSGKQESGWVLECATIEDWEAFPDRFARSRSLLEKDFCQFLRDEIIPKVIPDLQAKEKVKKVEEAMSNRKRSSRLQMRELEQEEQKRQQQLAQERRELQRQERAEADKRTKEEMERIRRIEAREQRIAERESRLRKIPRVSDGPMPTLDEVAAAQSAELKSRASSRQKRRKKEEEEEDEDRWYFDCICGVHGENLDDGAPMIACGRCNVWQHIACLARANGDTGNVDIKKWEELDFVCKNCEERKASLSNSSSDESTPVTEDVMTTTSHLSALGTPNGFADLLPQTASHLPQFNGTPITHQQPHAAGPHSQNGTSTPQSYIPPTHVVPLNHSTATTLPLIPDTAFHPVSITPAVG
ncbi:uncharacterized protein EV422DRAFT_393394 [Fimicolochytrium jonesii]|uniref:uncharacterized protein n=1 Tax=Fimicolochytrium jonesii TaxID=1396493 RepID=UPI0022FED73E|nr:uncharacterized protein EV422DRAFT_393394 [Fimicolochytrium jonesii]KAI8823140.1 hypothetical protein EV422DRAFT_393394 [Fimicolochytrium jonesii]